MSTLTALRQDLLRRIADLRELIRNLAADLAKVNAKTKRASGQADFTAAGGTTQVPVTWNTAFPDEQYGVWPTIYTTNPAQVHCVPLPATKTAAGITFTVTAGSAVGIVTLDVLAVRTS